MRLTVVGVPRGSVVSLLVLAVAGSLACNDPIQAPVVIDDIRVSPKRILSGAEIRLTSGAFAGFELFPLRGQTGFFDVPNRWSNLAVTIAGDTLDVWRQDDTTLVVATTGGLFSGDHDIEIRWDGNSGNATVGVVGVQRRTYWARLGAYNDVQEGYAVGPGRVIVFSPRWSAAIFVDLATGARIDDPRLDYFSYSNPDSRMPGASYRPRHAVLNLRDSSEPPRVWRLSSSIEPLDTIACYDANAYQVEVAEIGPGRCLGIIDNAAGDISIRANSTTAITPPDRFLRNAFLVVAPGGRWTVPVTREDEYDWNPGLSEWFVFDQTPAIAFRTSEYSQVTGAAFSTSGDSLYIVADRLRGRLSNQWVAEALDPSTGEVWASIDLEGRTAMAVYSDPVMPYLYVASRVGYGRKAYLTIIDRSNFRVIGEMETPDLGFGSVYSGVLVHGGSAGVIYLFAWCGWDCDMNITPFDLDYELFASLASDTP